MEHHYSLTSRMLAIFVSGLILLAILLFAAGLLAGREWGASEATERASAAQRSPASASAAVAPAPVAPQAAIPTAPAGAAAAGGAIRPPDALPPLPAAAAPAAAPKLPAAPALPAVPKLPSVPAAPKLPLPAKSSAAGAVRATELARVPSEPAERPQPQLASTASVQQERSARSDNEIHGFVVYVGAFENGAKAEDLVAELRRRSLIAQTSPVEKPGRKPLVAVWVGPFEERADAMAVLPAIRSAGVNDAMVRAVP
jgi:hypothetical protein